MVSEEDMSAPGDGLPPIKLAMIIDNEVVDVMHTDTRFAAILLSDPLIIDITPEEGSSRIRTYVGDTYDPETNKFKYEDLEPDAE